MISRFVDGVVGVFSPRIAAERQQYRQAIAAFARWDAARRDRPYENWLPDGASPDAELRDTLPDIRQRCRELSRNNPIASGIVNAFVRNVVGCGLRPQSRLNFADLEGVGEERALELQREAETAFAAWAPHADAGERTDFFGLQRLVQRAKVVDGEAFANVVAVRRRNRPFELAVQMIEADRVESPGGVDTPDRRMGVDLGRGGQPVRYHVRTSHPGDDIDRQETFTTVPVYDSRGGRRMLHVYRQLRPAQTRGVSRIAPVATTIKDLGEVLEAERIGKRIEACFSAFIKRELTPGSMGGKDSDGRQRMRFAPGMVKHLLPGEDIVFADPKRPGQTFQPYILLMVRLIASGTGLPLELVLMDWSSSNFSSTRGNILEARREFECEQQDLVERFCQPIWDAVLEDAWLRGEFADGLDFYANRAALTRSQWLPHGWAWIDPVKDVEGIRLAIETGLSTLPAEVGRRGRDWEDVEREKLMVEKRRLQLRKDMGLDAPAPTPAQGDEDEPDDGEPEDGEEPEEEEDDADE